LIQRQSPITYNCYDDALSMNPPPTDPPSDWPARLRQLLAQTFALEEIEGLCFDLNLDYDELSGRSKSQKIIALIRTLGQQQRLPELIILCQQARPHLDWTPFWQSAVHHPEQFLPQPVDRDDAPGEVIISGGDFRGAVINIQSTIVGAATVKEIEDQPPEPGDPPYKGLQYFDEADADRFFGRELLTAKVTGRLHQDRFLAVIGASGSGKSSLVRAGVIPALRRGERLADDSLPPASSAQWLIHLLTPSAHPLEALAASLMREAESTSAVASLQQELAQNPNTLSLAARQLLARQGRQRLLLVIDQFEELFTLCRQPEEWQAFIDNVVTAAASGDSRPITILIVLRADFYAQCAQHDRLRQLVSQQQEYIGAMSRDELARAIIQPAALGEWQLQEGLVELMLDDAGNEPGALPLLAHALRETWGRRRGRTLTLSAYRETGGVRGAIAHTAETIFQQRLTPAKQFIARAIFIRLTELGETAAAGERAVPDTRRRVQFAELITRTTDTQTLNAVLDILIDARLITTSLTPPQESPVIEVAHEALIREWPTLRQWLDENRAGLLRHRQLTNDVNEWLRNDRDPGYLYRGARLQQTVDWMAQPPDPLSLSEQEFLQASLAAVAAEEKRAQQLAYAQRRQRFLIGLAVVLLLALTGLAANLLGAFDALRQPGQMRGAFNIAVAEMAVSGDLPRESGSAVSARIASSLAPAFVDVGNVQVWHDSPELRRRQNVTIGVVSDSGDSAQEPAAVAKRLNADVVVYGTVAPAGNFATLQLRFYLAPQFGVGFNNMVGRYNFEQPIPLYDPVNPGLEIENPAQALAALALGLTYEVIGRPEMALAQFEKAASLLPDLDVIQYFLGQELFLLAQATDPPDLDLLAQAEAVLEQAAAEGQNARAQIGVGSVRLLRAQALLNEAREESYMGERILALQEVQAAAAEAFHTYATVASQPEQIETYGVPVNAIARLGQGITHRILGESAFWLGDEATARLQIGQGIDLLEATIPALDMAQDYRRLAQLYQALGTLYEWQAFLLGQRQDAAASQAALQVAVAYYEQCRQLGMEFPFDTYMVANIVQSLCIPSLEALTHE
jgi:hypothetical protein